MTLLDLPTAAIFRAWLEADLSLTPVETRIMQTLGEHVGEWVHKHAIVRAVYRTRAQPGLVESDWAALRTHMYRIRPKLLGTPWRIENRYHHGLYRLVRTP